MQKGTVKFFNVAKGYGFIKQDETEQEIFVHLTECRDQIRENDRVEFDKQFGTKGVNAVNVKLIESL